MEDTEYYSSSDDEPLEIPLPSFILDAADDTTESSSYESEYSDEEDEFSEEEMQTGQLPPLVLKIER